MQGRHQIVVGVDGSDGAAHAVRWAARHARDTGARLHLLHAAPLPDTATVVLPVPLNTRSGVLPHGPSSSRRLGWLSGSLLGATGARVAANAHCPTAVVRADGVPTGPVVVAVDASAPTQPALRYAFAEAARRRSRLVAVRCWTPPVLPAGSDPK